MFTGRPSVTRQPGECAGLSPFTVRFGVFMCDVYARDEADALKQFVETWNRTFRKKMPPEQAAVTPPRFTLLPDGTIADAGFTRPDRVPPADALRSKLRRQ